MLDRLDPHRREALAVADSRPFEQAGGADGAAGEDDLTASAGDVGLPSNAELDPAAAAAFDDHALDQGVGLEAQVGALQGGLQEGGGGPPAPAVLLGDLEVG